MSKRNSHESKQARRVLRAVRQHPQILPELRYLYEVGDEENTPGTYWPSDVHTVLLSRCTGCDCGDVMVGAITNNGRRLVLDVISERVYQHTCPDCNAKKLKAWAHRHGIPDCVIGSGDDNDPVRGRCERSHVCEKHPA